MDTNPITPVQTPSSVGNANPIPPAQNNSAGPIIGIIIIVLILGLGGAYFWYDMHDQAIVEVAPETGVTTSNTTTGSGDAVLDTLTNTSEQDTASAIEADLSSTDTGNASGELQLQ